LITVLALALSATLQAAPATEASARLILPFETGQLVIVFPLDAGEGCTARASGAFASLAPTACAALGFPPSSATGASGRGGGLLIEVQREGAATAFPPPPSVAADADDTAEVEVSGSGTVTSCRMIHTEGNARDLCGDLRGDSRPFLPAANPTQPRRGTVRIAMLTPSGPPAPRQ